VPGDVRGRLVLALALMRHTLRFLSYSLAFVLLAVNEPLACNAAPKQASLLSIVQRKSSLRSFDLYHADELALRPVRLTLADLVGSKDPNIDVLHIRATHELERALSETSVKGLCEMQGLDVRWAFVLNYEDGTHEVIGFTLYNNLDCVQVQSQPNNLAVSKALFEYAVRRFGFLSG
jgi:hypothetical protein